MASGGVNAAKIGMRERLLARGPFFDQTHPMRRRYRIARFHGAHMAIGGAENVGHVTFAYSVDNVFEAIHAQNCYMACWFLSIRHVAIILLHLVYGQEE